MRLRLPFVLISVPLLAALTAACGSSEGMGDISDDASGDVGDDGGQGGSHEGVGGAQGGKSGPIGGAGAGGKASGGQGGIAGNASGGQGSAGQGGPTGELMPCGDVQPNRDHAPFDAIKRLQTGDGEVRILVYGQSISEQDWWKQIHAWLKATYPKGNLVMESHARGGCSSQCLIGDDPWSQDNVTKNRLPDDVYAWRPDLILFHVYGSETAYERIVKGFKDNTSAQVLLQTDHRTKDDPMATRDERWSGRMATEYIPAFATKYGFSVAQVWQEWWDYMQANKQAAKVFLADAVHLNDEGNKLMAKLLKPHLCYKPAP